MVALVISCCVNATEVTMETGCLVEEDGGEVNTSVACEAESKPTSVTPYDGLSLLTLAAMYTPECTNVDGYFCQGTTVPAWYHLIGKYNLIAYKQARPAD